MSDPILESKQEKHRLDLYFVGIGFLRSLQNLKYTLFVGSLNDSDAFLKFIYSEKATKFCEIFILLLSYVAYVKSMVKISQNFVAFAEFCRIYEL